MLESNVDRKGSLRSFSAELSPEDQTFKALILDIVNSELGDITVAQDLKSALEVAEDELEKSLRRGEKTSLSTILFSLLTDPNLHRESGQEARVLVTLLHMAEILRVRNGSDGLTGLFNRERLDEDLDKLLHSRRKEDEHKDFAVVMMDIDKFKQINDTYGHIVGDQVIKSVVALVRHCLRYIPLKQKTKYCFTGCSAR